MPPSCWSLRGAACCASNAATTAGRLRTISDQIPAAKMTRSGLEPETCGLKVFRTGNPAVEKLHVPAVLTAEAAG
jgi:hypothetical protein